MDNTLVTQVTDGQHVVTKVTGGQHSGYTEEGGSHHVRLSYIRFHKNASLRFESVASEHTQQVQAFHLCRSSVRNI